MVFADLSGFTAMSERLSRLGRVGAEEVTDAIGTCFTELLAVAYDAGGSLLKFGGDALLPRVSRRGPCAPAVWAAAAMRERLREAGRLKTSAATSHCRMSVGVHSATFDCFLVGSPSRELLVTGAAASEVVAMEHCANAGQIVISASTAAALPDRCVGNPLEGGFLLRRAPDSAARLHQRTDRCLLRIDLREFVPVQVQEHVLAGGGAAEHRVVTVAFVHFDGSTRESRARSAKLRRLETLVTTDATVTTRCSAAPPPARTCSCTWTGTNSRRSMPEKTSVSSLVEPWRRIRRAPK